MTGERFTAPGLLAHLFLAAGGDRADPGRECLRSLWHDVTSRLGFDRAIPALAVPRQLAPGYSVPADRRGLLAAAERDADAVWQAAAWADHGLLCVSVMMAPPRDTDCRRAWKDLELAWLEAVGGLSPADVLGEARIFLALLPPLPASAPSGGRTPRDGSAPDSPAFDSTVGSRALRLLRAAPPEPAQVGWWQHWDSLPISAQDGAHGEVLTWEIGPQADDSRAVRRLAAVAPASAERRVDHLFWTTGTGAPAPMTRHLMHAARLRYQLRVFNDGEASHRLRAELGPLIDDLSGGSATGPAPAMVPLDRDWLSLRLRRLDTAIIALRSRLTDMRHAVDVISTNMRQALALPGGAAVGPLSADLELAAWFGQRLGDEINTLNAAAEQAGSVRDVLAGRALAAGLPGGVRAVAGSVVRRNGRAPQGEAAPLERSAVILTALPVEYEAIREYLAGPIGEREERGTLYELGTMASPGGPWHVAIAKTGRGSTAAGVHLERAIPVFRPELALFIGVAGGRKDVARGDVVVADAVYDYEAGKATLDRYEPRMRTHLPPHRLLQWAHTVARENRWQRRIRPVSPQPPPTAFIKPIVTGGKVVAHDRSEVALLIGEVAGDALAVEMEGYGFLEAAYLNPGTGALVIRGISDLLAGKDKADDDYWQPAASRHAVAFAVELLARMGTSRP